MLLRRITVGKVSVLFKSILLAAVIFSSGGGSALIQAFAWATMLPSQINQSSSVEEGISNTFSGEHPCGLCKICLLYTSPSPRDKRQSRMPSSA